MKEYKINYPYLNGILSDDNLYFEGIQRPVEIYTIRDGDISSTDSSEVLERYFNDIYNLFLRKMSLFSVFEYTSNEEIVKLQALLQELIKVKELIRELSKTKK